MADEEAEPAPEGGKSKLMIVLVVTNLLVVAGAGAAVFFAMSQPTQEAEAADEGDAPETLGPLVEVTTLVVNLSDTEGSRYLRTSLQIESPDEESKATVESRMVPIRSALLLYLSGLTAEDFVGTEAREAILEECKARIEEQAGEGLVRNVYIGDMVVQ
ncbi:MAG: flagellar basal body-associated protein FliL [Sandaracinaceae bacterium]